MKLYHMWLPVGLAVALVVGVGCGKKADPEADAAAAAEEAEAAAVLAAEAAAAAAPAANLRGSEQVMAALERKDYMAAVSMLMQIKSTLGPNDLIAYNDLQRIVKDEVINNMATSDSAKRAYDALRAIASGR